MNHRIAKRVQELRARQRLSLDSLARQSGVSRSMISLVERGESNPTAVVLEKLAAGLGVTMPAFFDELASSRERTTGPVSRRKDQQEWRDPASRYCRRNVSPAGVPQPMRIVDVHFPPGARVAFEASARDARVHQQIWMLKGMMQITWAKERHQLHEGDCLAMQLDGPTMFHNPTRKPARYAVVIETETASRR